VPVTVTLSITIYNEDGFNEITGSVDEFVAVKMGQLYTKSLTASTRHLNAEPHSCDSGEIGARKAMPMTSANRNAL
jgi:hypothetical protein